MDAHAPNPMGPANLEWQSRVDSFGAYLDTLASNPILPAGPRFWRTQPAAFLWSIGSNVEVSADDAARLCVEGSDPDVESMVASPAATCAGAVNLRDAVNARKVM